MGRNFFYIMNNGPRCRGFGWVDFRQKNPTFRCIGLPLELTEKAEHSGIAPAITPSTDPPPGGSDAITDMSRTLSAPSTQTSPDSKWQSEAPRTPMDKGRLVCLGSLYDDAAESQMRCEGVEVKWLYGDSAQESDIAGLEDTARDELVGRFGHRVKSVLDRAFSELPSTVLQSPGEIGEKMSNIAERILRRTGRISYRCGEILLPGYRPPSSGPPAPDDDLS